MLQMESQKPVRGETESRPGRTRGEGCARSDLVLPTAHGRGGDPPRPSLTSDTPESCPGHQGHAWTCWRRGAGEPNVKSAALETASADQPCSRPQGRPQNEDDRQPHAPKGTQTGKTGSLGGPCMKQSHSFPVAKTTGTYGHGPGTGEALGALRCHLACCLPLSLSCCTMSPHRRKWVTQAFTGKSREPRMINKLDSPALGGPSQCLTSVPLGLSGRRSLTQRGAHPVCGASPFLEQTCLCLCVSRAFEFFLLHSQEPRLSCRPGRGGTRPPVSLGGDRGTFYLEARQALGAGSSFPASPCSSQTLGPQSPPPPTHTGDICVSVPECAVGISCHLSPAS